MLLQNKKAEFPLIKTIVIILVVTSVLVSFLIVMMQAKDIYIDDKKINSQIVIDKILNKNCFENEEFGIFNLEKINQENLDSCLIGIENEILLRLTIEDNNGIIENKELFLKEKSEEFKQKASLCSLKSSILCIEMKYPIAIRSINKENKNEIQTKIMKLQIISQ